MPCTTSSGLPMLGCCGEVTRGDFLCVYQRDVNWYYMTPDAINARLDRLVELVNGAGWEHATHRHNDVLEGFAEYDPFTDTIQWVDPDQGSGIWFTWGREGGPYFYGGDPDPNIQYCFARKGGAVWSLNPARWWERALLATKVRGRLVAVETARGCSFQHLWSKPFFGSNHCVDTWTSCAEVNLQGSHVLEVFAPTEPLPPGCPIDSWGGYIVGERGYYFTPPTTPGVNPCLPCVWTAEAP